MAEHIKRYPSIVALADDADTGIPSAYRRHESGRDSWYGNEHYDECLTKARRGNVSLVGEAEKIIAKLTTNIEVTAPSWAPSCGGAYPVVPEYLLGMPEHMRRRMPVESEYSPVAIYVCLTSSSAIRARDMTKRGTAILALTIALSRIRPVTLNVFNVGARHKHESVIVAPINAAPLDLATACYVLTSAGFVRRLCYALAEHHHLGGSGLINWPAKYDYRDPNVYFNPLLRRLGGNPETDIIIPGVYSDDPLVSDPVSWINREIARFTNRDE